MAKIFCFLLIFSYTFFSTAYAAEVSSSVAPLPIIPPAVVEPVAPPIIVEPVEPIAPMPLPIEPTQLIAPMPLPIEPTIDYTTQLDDIHELMVTIINRLDFFTGLGQLFIVLIAIRFLYWLLNIFF